MCNYFKIWPAVPEKKIFKEFSHVPIVREALIHQTHVYGGIKISRTLFEKVHPRNIPVILFQNVTSSFVEEDFLRISSYPYIVQEAPIHQSHVFRRIKISQTVFEKGHPRNIPVKLFQNLTSGFGEDFLRISSCPYSARSPHSPEPCLRMDQNFTNTFWKGSPKNHSCEIISKSDQRFRRRFFKNFFMSIYKTQIDDNRPKNFTCPVGSQMVKAVCL